MTVRGLPGYVFEGTVARVQPPVGFTTRSLEVALKFNTDDPGLSQSMFAHVSILGRPKENVLLVPLGAVIRTGSEQRVVIKHDDGSYQPVVVVAGEESSGMVEILSGLQENDTVVTSGQFLIDSESNLLADFSRMSPTEITQSQSMDHHHHH
jgi:Cu(I)/Ag(I) efflux system membrane fusion protein